MAPVHPNGTDVASDDRSDGQNLQPDTGGESTLTNSQGIEFTRGQKDLIGDIRAGQCILFIGAGVHAAPDDDPDQYPEAERPLLGGGLAEALASTSEFSKRYPEDPPSDLQRVSLHVDTEKDLGRAKLVEYLKGHLRTGKKPSNALQMLAGLPFRIIVTTNYDSLLETSLRRWEKDPKISIYQPDDKIPTDDAKGELTEQEPFVFKMHGDLDEGASIVITDEDYIRFIQGMTANNQFHPIPETIRYYMKRWPTLFIGYSLRDYNLRLLFRTLRWGVDEADFPKSFSLDPKPDPLIMRVWQDREAYIAFVVHDLWSFVPRVYREVMGKDFAA